MYDEQGQKQDKPVLIIPAAGRSSRFPNMKPKWMLTHPSGHLMIEKVIQGLDTTVYKKIYIVILREHCDKYDADVILKQAFPQENFEVVVLEKPTASSPQTVYECLNNRNIDSWIVVKDCDCMVSYNYSINNRFVVGLNIKTKPKIQNLHQKSFIISDDNGIVVEIVEKSIVSEQICVGVYAMHSSELIRVYNSLKNSMGKEMYFSHVVSELIDENLHFFVCSATAYEDWGTKEQWFSAGNLKNTYFFDIDGVLLVNTGRYGRKNWFNTLEPIWENVAAIKQLCDDGHELVFVTSRTDNALIQIKEFLNDQNIRYKTIVSSCLHSKRIIVNDFANTNPFPSCVAINVPRNSIILPYIEQGA